MRLLVMAAAAVLVAATGGSGAFAQSPAQAQSSSDWRTVSPENLLVIDTAKGRILVELSPLAAPNHVERVRTLANQGFYDGLKFHRVIPNFMAQTGDPQGTGMGGMSSMRDLFINTLLGEPNQNDILQEALPNVVAAHVMQSYVGGYGSMVHPVAACATTAVSVEEGFDKIRAGKAEFVVSGGFDDLSIEGIQGFADMSATADSAAMAAKGISERHYSRAGDRRQQLVQRRACRCGDVFHLCGQCIRRWRRKMGREAGYMHEEAHSQ